VSGLTFFGALFSRFARAGNDATSSKRLSLVDLQQMFSVTPGVPWGEGACVRVSHDAT
jgi:hypothetical protein